MNDPRHVKGCEVEARTVLAGLGRVQLRDIARVADGGYATALTPDTLVKRVDTWKWKLTPLGEAVFNLAREQGRL